MIIIMTPYSKFLHDTAGYETPKRFGYDWFCCAIDKINEAKANGQMDNRDFLKCKEDIMKSNLLETIQKSNLILDLSDVFNRSIGYNEIFD